MQSHLDVYDKTEYKRCDALPLNKVTPPRNQVGQYMSVQKLDNLASGPAGIVLLGVVRCNMNPLIILLTSSIIAGSFSAATADPRASGQAAAIEDLSVSAAQRRILP
jgi:hypothetical protein